ncbi:MAG: DoxX family protein [Planctomycetia bacterium]
MRFDVLQKIAYWTTTALLSLAYLTGGYFDIAQPPEVAAGAAKLGYPLYFFTILGAWKLLAVIALLLPGTPRLKEWAYAGIVFNLTGASASHFAVKDGPGEVITPLVILAIALTSYATRSAARRLPGPIV